MKKIITIQHTQSIHHTNSMVGSWTDWELSELGIQQANKIGENLKNELNTQEIKMYSSDLLRTKQTAKIVGNYCRTYIKNRTKRKKPWKMLWKTC